MINGHGGDKYAWYSFYTGVLYARGGAAVLTYDPIGEGERNRDRKSGTRAHDEFVEPREMGRRMGGLMLTDALQAISFLSERPEVDPERIAAAGYSMGSLILAFAGSVDERLHACILVGGGNIDGPGGVWDNSKPMCQAIPYQSLRFLGDRPATIYAMHASRGPTLIVNGTADTIVQIPTQGDAFFPEMKERTVTRHGGPDGVFEFRLVSDVSHRPFFVTPSVAVWLERKLDLPSWTENEIQSMPTTHISRWVQAGGVDVDSYYASEEREGGVRALGDFVPPLTREQLSVFPSQEWKQRRADLIYEEWVERALAKVSEN